MQTILVAEVPGQQALTDRKLRNAGFHAAYIAEDLEDALYWAEQHQPDLIITERRVPPAPQDWELVRRVRALGSTADIPILGLLPQGAAPADIAACVRAGCTEYLVLPVLAAELEAKVRRLLTGA